MGHEVFNYGMYSAEDTHQLTYVQNGILAAVLLNSGAADFVITGCGTGEGAMLACNAFPQVLCGHIESPLYAYLFSQVRFNSPPHPKFSTNGRAIQFPSLTCEKR